MAHIKQADYILNIFQSIIEILFFFNPAVWSISKTIRTEREYLCDDLAVETCGNSITLAKALLFVQSSDYTKTKIAMAVIGNNNSLMGRIKRMTHSKIERTTFGTVITIIPMLLILAFLAFPSLVSKTVAMDITPAQTDIIESVSTSRDMEDDERMKISFNENNFRWKAYFEDDKLVELFKDGKQVPEGEFSKYEDFIYKHYEEFKDERASLDIQMDELKIGLQQLKIDLSGLKDIKIDFDKEKFADEMKEMKRELKEGLAELEDLNFDFDFDVDELHESLKNIKINLSGFDDDMSTMKIELGGLKKELKFLKHFFHDLRDGLVDDGYLESDDQDFDLELTKTKMVVDGKRLSDKTHQKYLELYKEHYGKELDDEFNISK